MSYVLLLLVVYVCIIDVLRSVAACGKDAVTAESNSTWVTFCMIIIADVPTCHTSVIAPVLAHTKLIEFLYLTPSAIDP